MVAHRSGSTAALTTSLPVDMGCLDQTHAHGQSRDATDHPQDNVQITCYNITMVRPIRYRSIVDALRTRIQNGDFAPGDRVPSENELAVRHSVSRPTAGRALQELVRAGLLERRVGAGTYVRDRSPSGPTTVPRSYGLLVPGLVGTEILGPICTEVTRVCQDVGAVVLWPEPTDVIDAVGEADRLTRLYLERGVDGVFFAPLEAAADRQTENVRIAATMRSKGIAVVLLDRDVLEFPDRSDYDLVGIDNFQAGLRLTQHLIDVGRQRTCFLAKPHAPSTTDLRAAGAREALRRAGITVGSQWQLSGAPNDEGFVRRFLDRDRPDAVICSNDLTAALLIQTLLRMEVSVPRDVAIVGFDDVAYSTLLSVELTTMRQPIRGIARAALRAMTDRLEGSQMEPQQILLSADLIVRQSCGAPRTNLPHAES